LNSTIGSVGNGTKIIGGLSSCSGGTRPKAPDEATTPWLKEQLAAAIARHDQIVEEIETASRASAETASTSLGKVL